MVERLNDDTPRSLVRCQHGNPAYLCIVCEQERTDTPRDPLTALAGALYDTDPPESWMRTATDEYRKRAVEMIAFLAAEGFTLDATRPSGDEALRAAAKDIVTSFARRPGWTLEHDSEEADALRAALATQSSAPDHREGRDPGNDGWAGSGRCARCGEPWPCPSSAPDAHAEYYDAGMVGRSVRSIQPPDRHAGEATAPIYHLPSAPDVLTHEECIHGVSEREECEHCGLGWEASPDAVERLLDWAGVTLSRDDNRVLHRIVGEYRDSRS